MLRVQVEQKVVETTAKKKLQIVRCCSGGVLQCKFGHHTEHHNNNSKKSVIRSFTYSLVAVLLDSSAPYRESVRGTVFFIQLRPTLKKYLIEENNRLLQPGSSQIQGCL